MEHVVEIEAGIYNQGGVIEMNPEEGLLTMFIMLSINETLVNVYVGLQDNAAYDYTDQVDSGEIIHTGTLFGESQIHTSWIMEHA